MIKFKINNKDISADKPASVLDIARDNDIEIPHLCSHPLLEKFGGCRMCLVEVEGRKKLEASCTLIPCEGMVVHTETERVIKARQAVLEFLLINHPLDCPSCDKSGECKLQDYTVIYGPSTSRFVERKARDAESTHDPLIVRNMERCITCTRCVRACTQIQGASAISVMGKGKRSFIEPFDAADFNCDYCGTCITVCPVGSLMSKLHRHNYRPWETTGKVDTICPFCGVGCSLTLQMRDTKIQRALPLYRSGVNGGILCARGYFGYEYSQSPERLTTPLIRKDGKLEPASYDEAIEYIAERLKAIKQEHGAASIAGLASTRATNEDNFMLQKLIRGMGSDNIDSMARMGLAATRDAFDRLLRQGSTATEISQMDDCDVALVMGGDPTGDSPVLGVRVRNVHMRGGKVITTGMALGLRAHTDISLGSPPATEGHLIAALLGMMKGIDNIDGHPLASVDDIASICDREMLKEAASILSKASSVAIVIGRGLAASEHGSLNLRVAAELIMMLPAAKLYVSSEGTNENGALDMGCAPGVLAGGVSLEATKYRLRYKEIWGVELPSSEGLTLMEMIETADTGGIKAMYVMGQNPIANLPDSTKTTKALKKLDLLVVQDIFATQTTELADVVLPVRAWPEKDGTFTNLERRIQIARNSIKRNDLMEDWQILGRLCSMMGINESNKSAEDVLKEAASLSPLHAALSYDKIASGKDMYPYTGRPPAEDLCAANKQEKALTGLPTIKDKMQLSAAPDSPLFINGTITLHSEVLRGLMKEPKALVSPRTAKEYSLIEGGNAEVSTGAGKLTLKISLDKLIPYNVLCISSAVKDSTTYNLISYTLESDAKTPYLKAVTITLKMGG